MVKKHAAGEKKIRMFNKELEQRVLQRTLELEDANKALEHEVTERRWAEEKLIESEKRYKRLLESVTDSIYTVKIEDGIPVATSHIEGCVALTGYSPEEYASDPYLWYKMIYDSDKEAVKGQTEKMLSGETVPAIEHRIIHKDGSVRWVRNTSVPRYDKDGRLVAYDCLISDITHRKRIEEQLYQSQKMESIGRLSGTVAHDFNNYLTAIIGFSETLMRKLKPEDAQYKIMQKISSSALKAAEMTHKLLAFSRKQIVEPRVLNLNDCVKGIRKMLERLLGEDVELVTRLAPDIGSVRVDPTQMEQIITNLAINARDAMPTGGKLTIETSGLDLGVEAVARCAGIPAGRYVLLSVSDVGTGIPESARPFIFDPFFTTKEKNKGGGLGLSTVYGIVQQHQGKIVVSSEEGKGTTFTIYLPLIEEKAGVVTAEPPEKSLPCGSEVVLVVEDEETVRDVAAQTLTMQGYTVIEAVDGKDALRVCSNLNKPVDLIITDVVMPNMSGGKLIEQFRAAWKDCKILCMSGYGEDIMKSRGFPVEKVNFIKKPFTTITLLNKVREVLDGPGKGCGVPLAPREGCNGR